MSERTDDAMNGERTTEIVANSQAIIDAIEARTLALSQAALAARRLAQVLDDDAAFVWLTLECSGVDALTSPERAWKDNAETERGIRKWHTLRAVPDLRNVPEDGPLAPRTHAMGASLAALESHTALSPRLFQGVLETPTGQALLISTRAQDHERRRVLGGIAVAVHEWATGVYIAHRFRQLAGSIFERFKTRADVMLARICPDGLSKLNHAVERTGSEHPEDWSAAALSCRRVLKDFADSVYPPRGEKVDGRAVGEAEYKNRLWAFAKERGSKAIEKEFLATEEIDGLCRALDRVYELDSKGIHDSITRQEAHLAVLRTYILLEQLGQLGTEPAPPGASGS